MTIEKWLAPVSDEQPSGPNLEYEAEFLRLEEAAREELDAEVRRDGGEVVRSEGKRADWIQVQTLAESMLLRSKDLRLAVWLTRAWLHTRGFSGIGDGLALIVGLLDAFWDSLHPELDPDDPEDPAAMRANSLLQLSSPVAVVRDLRASLIFQSRRRGQLAVREIEIAQGRLKPADDKPALTEAQLIELLAAAVEEDPNLPQQAQAALAGVRAVTALFDQRAAGATPDLALLQAVLYSVTQALKLVVPQVAAEADDEPAAEDDGRPEQRRTVPTRSVSGEISSREDVVLTLGRLCDYLVRHEPTNPVQLLLRRAQRMMNMSFLELMQDVAPDGLLQAETVVGEKLHKDEEE